MKKIWFIAAAALVLAGMFCSCSSEKKVEEDISAGWKYKFGDSKSFKLPDYIDSGWDVCPKLGAFNFPEGQHYVWVRKTVDVSSDLDEASLWLNYPKSNTAAEIYADGVLIGLKGSLPPDVNIRTEKKQSYLIPENCIHGGQVKIAVRIYCAGCYCDGLGFKLVNQAHAQFDNGISHIFDQKMFLIICFICVFFFFYSAAEFVYNKDHKEFLYFALSLFFVVLYFFDLGSDTLFLPYNFNRAFTRACLPISMNFMTLFFNTFFKRPKTKQLLIPLLAYDVIQLGANLFFMGRDNIISTIFLVNLITVLFSLIYGFRVGILAVKAKQFGAKQVIIGLALASVLAIHDVVCQAAGIQPLIWLQGVAFFCIDLSLFITVFQRSNNANRKVIQLAEETGNQKEKLENVFSNARSMASESVNIAQSLNDSVTAVANAAESSKNKVDEINSAIAVQTKIREETARTIDNLTQSLGKMSTDFKNEVQMINKTAQGTKDVIDGMKAVSEGIQTAADFTSSLSVLTKAGSSDMRKLKEVMAEVQESSNEILGVVTTLDDFAQQTDLLSMNASIEAAHSGAAGKGFAVIAHEIKSLAAKTSQWSSRIGEIISSVIRQIQKSVELCQKVDDSLSKINTGATESASKVGAAASGMAAQQEASAVISRESTMLIESAAGMDESIRSQSEFAGLVMGNMEKLQEASAAVNTASDQIQLSSKSLSEQAQELMQLASRTNQSAQDLMKLMEE